MFGSMHNLFKLRVHLAVLVKQNFQARLGVGGIRYPETHILKKMEGVASCKGHSAASATDASSDFSVYA